MAWAEKRGNRWRVRYYKDDGTIGSIPGFPNKTAATNHAGTIDSDQRKGTWIDPDAGKITLTEWSIPWWDALDVAGNTEVQYRSILDNHILPRWGEAALSDITGIGVAGWAKKLRAKGYADATVRTILKLLTMMLADAADEHLIPANPIRPRRRGKRHRVKRRERLWATHDHVLQIAHHATVLNGRVSGLLIITGAYTGARWGELNGLQRHRLHLDDNHPRLVIDPHDGALHEINGHFSLGPPKTTESARTIALSPFLAELLRTHLRHHPHRHVFTTSHGDYLRRSNFARRAMRPATDGTTHRTDPPVHVAPVVPGLTFHGLRHSHKTWLITDGIPEIAQAQRLGHTLQDEIQATYSHVDREVEHRILNTLQDRWDKALTNHTGPLPSHWLTPTP